MLQFGTLFRPILCMIIIVGSCHIAGRHQDIFYRNPHDHCHCHQRFIHSFRNQDENIVLQHTCTCQAFTTLSGFCGNQVLLCCNASLSKRMTTLSISFFAILLKAYQSLQNWIFVGWWIQSYKIHVAL
jgi:hypothetical protein